MSDTLTEQDISNLAAYDAHQKARGVCGVAVQSGYQVSGNGKSGIQFLKGEMMKNMMLGVGLAVVLGIGSAQAAGDVQAGKAKAAICAGCHGPNGEGIAPNPALAGKSEDVFVQALKDFKSGKPDNAVMKGMANTLSDQDMTNLAAYYASLKAK